MTARNKTFLLCAAAASILLSAAPATAQDLFPAKGAAVTAPAGLPAPTPAATAEYQISPDEDTHPILRLTPDKSELVRLDTEARSIIVGNPQSLSVLMDNARTLVLVPHAPGATQFTVLDRNGKIVMQRHVIIASPKTQYIRVRRACTTGNCAPTSVYYCPDMCHEVSINTDVGSGMSGVSALYNGPSPGAAAATVPPVNGNDADDQAIDSAVESLEEQMQDTDTDSEMNEDSNDQ